jgi:hypothetical protein
MIVLKDNRVNRDCLLVYKYISECGGLLFRDLRDAVASGTLVGFESNLVYCLRKLREYKCIDVISNRNNGRFDQSIIVPLCAAIIEVNRCRNCGETNFKKSRKAKYHDLCLECTRIEYMSSKE